MSPRTKSNLVYYGAAPLIAMSLILNEVSWTWNRVGYLALGMLAWCLLTMAWENQLTRAANRA